MRSEAEVWAAERKAVADRAARRAHPRTPVLTRLEALGLAVLVALALSTPLAHALRLPLGGH